MSDQNVFDILKIKGTDNLSLIRRAYRNEIRVLVERAGGIHIAEKTFGMQELNSAYDKVKTQEKLDRYIRENPLMMIEKTPTNDIDIPSDLIYITPKDRLQMKRGNQS